MPSNYTIAKQLKRISDYQQISGIDPHHYAEGSFMIQGLAGVKIEDLYQTNELRLREMFHEADDEFFVTLGEIIKGEPIHLLQGGEIPVSILELTEIKGLGPKMARKLYDELKVSDLAGLKEVTENGSLAKLKGFGPKMVEKINAHLAKKPKSKKTAE